MAVFGLLGGQDRSQTLERVRRIHRAGRVVRGVDKHDLHVRVKRSFECVEVDLEVLGVGRHDGQLGAGALDVRLVFGEVGGEGDDLVARLGHRTHRVGQRARRARGREDVVAGVCHAETFVEIFGDRVLDGRDAERGGVAVDGHRIAVFVEVDHGVGEGFRSRHRGIAKAVIGHVLVADFGTAARGVLAQFANHGLAAKHGLVFLIDHGCSPRMVVLVCTTLLLSRPVCAICRAVPEPAVLFVLLVLLVEFEPAYTLAIKPFVGSEVFRGHFPRLLVS